MLEGTQDSEGDSPVSDLRQPRCSLPQFPRWLSQQEGEYWARGGHRRGWGWGAPAGGGSSQRGLQGWGLRAVTEALAAGAGAGPVSGGAGKYCDSAKRQLLPPGKRDECRRQ